MDKILRALYRGEIYPAEQYRPTTKDYKVAYQEYNKRYDDFIAKIGSPFDKEFERIMEEYRNTFSMELSKMFIEGFRLGAKLVIEIFSDENCGEKNQDGL